jgi:DNA-binding HxlR family transcriptional regulator
VSRDVDRTPVEVATTLVGDAWAVLVLREAVLLGTHRFVDFRESLQVNRATLVDRLNGLVGGGLLERQSAAAHSDRAIYVPTAAGNAYLPVLLSLMEWGRKWLVPPEQGTVLHVHHQSCGAALVTTLTCAACGGFVDAHSVDAPRPDDAAQRNVTDVATRMPRLDQLERGHRCPIARALASFGDRWSTLVIQEAFYGLHHFEAFTRRLGIASNTLTNRLARLSDHGILDRRVRGGRPSYHLTEKGLDLYPVPATLHHWSTEWLGVRVRDPLRHRWCGEPLAVVVRCTSCGQPADSRNVSACWPST